MRSAPLPGSGGAHPHTITSCKPALVPPGSTVGPGNTIGQSRVPAAATKPEVVLTSPGRPCG